MFWIRYFSYSTRRQIKFHTKLPDEGKFLKCGTCPKKFSYFKQVRKQKIFVPTFSSNRKFALAVSTLGEGLPFQLIGKTMSAFLVSLMLEGSTWKHPQNKARQWILPLLCLLLQHQYHHAWPLPLESNIAHEVLWIDSHENKTLVPTMSYN